MTIHSQKILKHMEVLGDNQHQLPGELVAEVYRQDWGCARTIVLFEVQYGNSDAVALANYLTTRQRDCAESFVEKYKELFISEDNKFRRNLIIKSFVKHGIVDIADLVYAITEDKYSIQRAKWCMSILEFFERNGLTKNVIVDRSTTNKKECDYE